MFFIRVKSIKSIKTLNRQTSEQKSNNYTHKTSKRKKITMRIKASKKKKITMHVKIFKRKKITCLTFYAFCAFYACKITHNNLIYYTTKSHRYFPVNFAKFLITPFLQNTFGRMLFTNCYHPRCGQEQSSGKRLPIRQLHVQS